ncbi:hypothetical protein DSL92_07440 [Billgrantia gudaonensis]|uniref:Uncharacterized protein n=1 Tax=Billgrantia gudaonensis TaxID=376427 RepID=A0A432JHX5_9GAMM|nr:hypothetical protein DSL92_07440 [Halomonas gudaonensis]
MPQHGRAAPRRAQAGGGVPDEAPLPADWLWLCRFTARYYQHPLGDTPVPGNCRCCQNRGRPPAEAACASSIATARRAGRRATQTRSCQVELV